MVAHQMSLHYHGLFLLCQIPENRTQLTAQSSVDHLLAILRNEHYVIFAFHKLCALDYLCCDSLSLLPLSPERFTDWRLPSDSRNCQTFRVPQQSWGFTRD